MNAMKRESFFHALRQQWMMRNSNISTPSATDLGGQWNVVLVGCTGTLAGVLVVADQHRN